MTQSFGKNGAFAIPFNGVTLFTIASDEGGWEHVSVHADGESGKRIPTWGEMCYVKDLFWKADECVMQLHPPKSDYVNNHPCVLHLWRPLFEEIPRPSKVMV